MEGYKDFFRIRIGDYRIGLLIHGNSVDVLRVLNRKDIYKYFP
ncbi:MAG: type II toxin-antitoxin system RelE/ParE family toxin [Bacteroidia bacterium]